MDNYLLMKKTEELVNFSKELGFENTYFLGTDFSLIKNIKSKKELLKKIRESKLKTIYFAETEELLRFALEKTDVNMVIGAEKINPRNSVHFLRGALDQIVCKIAAEKSKTIVFSFNDILQDSSLIDRMKLNLKLCRRYNVSTIFSNFCNSKWEMRSAKDLQAFFNVLNVR
jgi:RNase P/RNase MRP subunit p30